MGVPDELAVGFGANAVIMLLVGAGALGNNGGGQKVGIIGEIEFRVFLEGGDELFGVGQVVLEGVGEVVAIAKEKVSFVRKQSKSLRLKCHLK